MSTTQRRLRLMELLEGADGLTLRALSQRFGVAKNTIQRDLDELTIAGVPITETADGQTLRFRITGQSRRAPEPEAPLHGPLDTNTPAVIHPGGRGATRRLLTALSEHRRVRIAYRPRGTREVRRLTIEPRRVRAAAGLRYLDATLVDGALRTFAVHRIVEVRLQRQTFTPRPLRPRTAFGAVEGEPTRVAVRFGPQVAEYIAERKWHPSQRVRAFPDGSLLWRGEVSGEREFLGWVLSWAPHAVVVSPRAWRAAVFARAEAAAHAHRAARS